MWRLSAFTERKAICEMPAHQRAKNVPAADRQGRKRCMYWVDFIFSSFINCSDGGESSCFPSHNVVKGNKNLNVCTNPGLFLTQIGYETLGRSGQDAEGLPFRQEKEP